MRDFERVSPSRQAAGVAGGVWWLVGLLSATATASYLCRVNVSVAGVLIMRDFGLSQIAMGRVFSAFLVGYALFQVPAGMLAGRFGARRVLAVSALWWAAGTVLLAAVGWGPLELGAGAMTAALLAVRFFLGVGEAPTFPSAGRAVSRWLPPAKQGRANGMVIAAIGVGSAIAPPLITFVMVRWGWRAALLISALPALASGLAWLAIRTPDERSAATRRRAAIGTSQRLRSRSFLLLTLSYTLQGYVGYVFVFWFYLYLVDVRRFDLLRGAALTSLPWILSIVSIPLGGLISPALTPVLAASMGWENALNVAAVLSVVAAVLWLGIAVHESGR